MKDARDIWKQNLTPAEKISFQYFTGDGYRIIRQYLQDNTIEEISEERIKMHIDNLDSALMKFCIPKNQITYRAEGRNSPIVNTKVLEGLGRKIEEIEYRSFISTSLSSRVAEDHRENLRDEYGHNVFLILEGEIPKGEKCAYLGDDLSAIAGEAELLIMRRKKFIKLQEAVIVGNETLKLVGKYNPIPYRGIGRNFMKFELFWGKMSDVVVRVNERLTEDEESLLKIFYPNALIVEERKKMPSKMTVQLKRACLAPYSVTIKSESFKFKNVGISESSELKSRLALAS